jgi:hypothetical protein
VARNTALEETFLEEYFARNGRHWLHYFDSKPRPMPSLPMRPAPFPSHKLEVISSSLYW